MSAYAPESSLGWLDLDAVASERVGTLLRSLEEPTTLDVLGLGAVRDAFSEILSPGTSTIQTRLRYFIFLPCILRGLEDERVSPTDFARRLRHEEAQLIDCLRHLGSNQGVIGYTAGRELKRMPSEIYWGGLGAWGIRRLDLSLSEYGKRASTLGRQRHERDDDGNTTTRVVSMWPDIRLPKDFLQDGITFELHPEEAQFLADCIRRRHPDSLLAVLCGMPGVANGVAYPWDLPTNGLPDGLVETLHHARCFSELSWDTVVRLDEASDGAGALLGPVGDLFEGLLGVAVGAVSPDHRDRVRSLSAALATTRFALPAGVDNLRTHVLGLRRTPSPLPAAAERSLIISPFVSDDFFSRVRPAPVDELVSRPESLELLRPGTLSTKVAQAYVFDDRSTPDVDAEPEPSSPDDPGRPLAGLHAKVFAFEDAGRARLFLGSANATGAAFTNNVEILVELAGPATVLGIDRLCHSTRDEPGLRDLFNPYGGPDRGGDTDADASPLDRARRVIARLPLEGIVEESGSEWAVTYRSRQPVPNLDGTEIYCWPLATAGHRRRVATGEPFEARFETSLETISGFLAFELADREGRLTRFVVPTPLFGVPDHRERFLLRALVGNAERFLRYLLALLDEDSGQTDLRDAVEGVSDTADADGSGPMSLPVLEKLLRTMRRDPAKLAGLHPLVSDLADDDALPPGFADLWTMIYDVAIAGDVDQ